MRTRTALQMGLLAGGVCGVIAYSARPVPQVMVDAIPPPAISTTVGVTPGIEGQPPDAEAQLPGIETLPSGLKIVTLRKGNGPKPRAGQVVSVHYTGTLKDGTRFDSTRDRGGPFQFPLGQGLVIRGWDEGIARLHVGERARLILPPDLAYGDAGAPPDIPPKAELTFDVELMGIK